MVLRGIKWAFAGIASLAAMLVGAVLLVAFSQDGSVRALQYYLYRSVWHYPPNSFEPRAVAGDAIRSDGVRVTTEIRYGSKYPNSYLDVWRPDDRTSVKRPTVIFMHGGGWFMGDKASGDPLAKSDPGGVSDMLLAIVQQGFAVVNLNYALSPEFRHPVQINQLNEAIRFLSEHGDEYGVDMTQLVIMGGSAGAHMAAQYGLLVSDPSYAQEMEIKPAIDRSYVKALVLHAAPLKLSGRSWRFDTMIWAYLGTKDLENSKPARLTDIISRLGSRYPATFLTDGNADDTFPDHAKAMAQALRVNKIDYVFNYYEPSEAVLGHGYPGELNTKHGRENLDKTIAFIKQRTSQAGVLASGSKSMAPAPLERASK